MYKTVVFDLDGTLLNTLTDLADAGNRLCRKYGWPTHERQAYRYFVGNGIPGIPEMLGMLIANGVQLAAFSNKADALA